ncbi:MAG: TetR/AcrR family transcriptional regulator [Bacteroidota bacterium]
MKKIKNSILEKSRDLFNELGVANVSIRQISRELGISHSNLIYHYKDKNALIVGLHQQIFESAIQINSAIVDVPPLKGIFISTIEGYKVLYNYRFFMLDLVWILRENETLHQTILGVEKERFRMYKEKIDEMIADGVLVASNDLNDYTFLIEHVKVFSDTWLTIARIYEVNLEDSIKKYAKLFLFLFYPYLTPKGTDLFKAYLQEFDL